MECPACSYQNSDADLCCNLCGTVFPPAIVDERLALLKETEQTAKSVTRTSTERLARPPTGRLTRPATDRIARIPTDTIPRPVAPPATTVVELVARAQAQEFRKNLVRTGVRVWRLTRHTAVCFVTLLLICLFREGVFLGTETITDIGAKSWSAIIGFCLVMGVPTGLLVSLRGAGRFRGFAIATGLFAVEPSLLRSFVTLPEGMQFSAWSLLDLVAAVLAGFVVGLYAEIDR